MQRMMTIVAVLLCIAISGCMSLAKTDSAIAAEPFTYVYGVPGMTQAQIYKKGLLWIADTYNSAESVITFQDEESGTIKGTGIGQAKATGDMFTRSFRYNISIDTKENKVRVSFDNISPQKMGDIAGIGTNFQAHYDAIKANLDKTAESLNAYLTAEDGGDW